LVGGGVEEFVVDAPVLRAPVVEEVGLEVGIGSTRADRFAEPPQQSITSAPIATRSDLDTAFIAHIVCGAALRAAREFEPLRLALLERGELLAASSRAAVSYGGQCSSFSR
jgi:hypothetical protein